MKGKITAVLFILVFLLVVAVVFTFLTSLDRRREAEANQPAGNDVVVTEYGIARLKGRTLQHRAEDLIRIAHPDVRPMLIEEYEQRFKCSWRPED